MIQEIPAQLPLWERRISDEEVDQLVSVLRARGWQTRKQLRHLLGWSERKVRAVAEHAGAEVVRGPRGFTIYTHADPGDILHCAEIALSQGKHMIRYAVALKRRLHATVA